MIAFVGTVVIASLLGSLHCAGMCGGLVSLYAGGPGPGRRGHLGHLLYNLGRLASYVALGVVAGVVGSAVDSTGALAGFQRSSAVLAGILIILIALKDRLPRLSALARALPSPLRTLARRAMARLHALAPPIRALALGGLSALLPCGWLYAFAVTAAGTGSAWQGAIVMLAFWSGTVPVMLGLGYGIHAVAGPLRRRVPALVTVLLVTVGLLTISGRYQLVGTSLGPARAVPPDDRIEHVESLDSSALPCCHEPK